MRVDPKLIIKTLKKNNGAVRATARELGISPGTVINWRKEASDTFLTILAANDNKAKKVKYLRENVKRQSTRPKTVRSTTLSATDQDAILKLRKDRGYGASKIKSLLRLPVSINTIHRFLKKRGKTAPGKNYRRPRLQGTKHMYLKNTTSPGKLQMDIKYVTPELSGLPHTTYLYAIIDIYTRWKAGIILPHLDQELAIHSLRHILNEFPEELMPKILRKQIDFIQTDNGLEFQSQFHKFVTEELASILSEKAGNKRTILHHHTHKSSPNENAVIERSFRTDEEEFFWRIEKVPQDLEELNEQYWQYLRDYNTYRPHIGLNYLTPQEKLWEYEGV